MGSPVSTEGWKKFLRRLRHPQPPVKIYGTHVKMMQELRRRLDTGVGQRHHLGLHAAVYG